jgi:hypothetical protein
MDDFFKIVAAGPAFFVSAWLLMLFAGTVDTEVGIQPFGYLTSMVVTIALWLTLAPAIGAIARTGKSNKKQEVLTGPCSAPAEQHPSAFPQLPILSARLITLTTGAFPSSAARPCRPAAGRRARDCPGVSQARAPAPA